MCARPAGRGANRMEALMKSNVGGVDRAIRITVGAALVLATLFGWVGAWGWIGLVPIATGTLGTCPAYLPFGINTCKVKS
jgi:hypothetical protein